MEFSYCTSFKLPPSTAPKLSLRETSRVFFRTPQSPTKENIVFPRNSPFKIPKIKTTGDLLSSLKLQESFKLEDRPISPTPRKVTVPITLTQKKLSKAVRSLSPPLRNLDHEQVDTAKLLRKYKQKRADDQERGIQLIRLAKQLEEELDGETMGPRSKVATLFLRIVELALKQQLNAEGVLPLVPELMEEYMFCVNEELCMRIAAAFEIKSYNIKNMIFPTLVETLCKKAESLKSKTKVEIDSLLEKIDGLEKNITDMSEEIKNKVENIHNGDHELIEEMEKETMKLKEKIFYHEKEKNHLINSNTQLQEDLVKLTEASKKEKDLMERELKEKIQSLEESNLQHVELIANQEKESSNQKSIYHSLLEHYKRSMVFLKNLKEKMARKEIELSEIMNENQKLKVRAASAWEEFTPRPSFKSFANFLDINSAFFEKKTTVVLADELSKLCNEKIMEYQKDRPRKSRVSLFHRSNTNKSLPKENESGGGSPKARWTKIKCHLNKITHMEEPNISPRLPQVLERRHSKSWDSNGNHEND